MVANTWHAISCVTHRKCCSNDVKDCGHQVAYIPNLLLLFGKFTIHMIPNLTYKSRYILLVSPKQEPGFLYMFYNRNLEFI